MAKHGIQGMVGGGSAEGGAMHKVVLAGRRRTPSSASTSNSANGCASASTSSWPTPARTASAGRKYYEENMKMFGELRLVRAMTDEQVEIMRDPKRAPTAKLPRIEDAVKAGGFLTGTPDEIIDQLKAMERSIRHWIGSLQPVGRRAEVRGAGAAAALRRGGDAGVQKGEGGRARACEVVPVRQHAFHVMAGPCPGHLSRHQCQHG